MQTFLRTSALVVAALSTFGGCDAPDAERARDDGAETAVARRPILGGDVDRRTHAAVALLGEEFLCTGSLIAPNLVLTARHCVADIVETGDFLSCDDSFGALWDASTMAATTATAASDGPFVGVERIFVRSEAGLCDNDVALVLLESSIPATEAVPLVPRVDERPRVGEGYTAVGYGNPAAGTRRRLGGRELVCVGPGCGTESDALVGRTDWVGTGGVCPGDSGGPALDEFGRVIGVASRADEACEWGLYAAVEPISDWIREVAAIAADDGGYAPASWVTTGVSHPPGDPDFDGVDATIDNCPDVGNPTQRDLDGDGIGDACDPFDSAARGGDCPVCDGCIDDSDCDEGSFCLETVDGAWCTFRCDGTECPMNTVCGRVTAVDGTLHSVCANDDWREAGMCEPVFICLDRPPEPEDTGAPDTGLPDSGFSDTGALDTARPDTGAGSDTAAVAVPYLAPGRRGCATAGSSRSAELSSVVSSAISLLALILFGPVADDRRRRP